jgi:hypothetical protein
VPLRCCPADTCHMRKPASLEQIEPSSDFLYARGHAGAGAVFSTKTGAHLESATAPL